MDDQQTAVHQRCPRCGVSSSSKGAEPGTPITCRCGRALAAATSDGAAAPVEAVGLKAPGAALRVPFDEAFLQEYDVRSFLGEGSFGAVYEAIQRELGRVVAVKFTTVPDPESLSRFQKEGQLLAQLRHENIIQVYASGSSNGHPYLVFEFVQGATLKERIRGDGALPPGEAVDLAVQVLLALDHAHAQGIIHRDVKSENVILPRTGGVKVADFGLAKAAASDRDQTRSGIIIGTPAYMAPEQAMGEPVDGRADVYSVGIVLFELLTGTLPFTGAPMEVLMAQVNAARPRVRERNPAVPEDLDALVFAAMQRRPEERPGSAAELARRLRAVRPAGRRPRVTSQARPLRSTIKSMALAKPASPTRSWPWLAAALGVAGLVGAMAAVLTQPPGSMVPRPSIVPSIGRVATPKPSVAAVLAKEIPGGDGAPMVLVPQGAFTMGMDQQARVVGGYLKIDPHRAESPRHRVWLDGFYIDKYEVTNEQYDRFCKATGRPPPPYTADDPPEVRQAKFPVVHVDWQDACDYCRWVNERLPTEAEWEKAARGTDERPFPWGDAVPFLRAKCKTGGISALLLVVDTTGILDREALSSLYKKYPQTVPVGSFPLDVSPCGAMDMGGNASEWCADWFDGEYYVALVKQHGTATVRDPQGPGRTTWKVARGGDFTVSEASVRTTGRKSYPPRTRDSSLGFRCVRSVSAAPSKIRCLAGSESRPERDFK